MTKRYVHLVVKISNLTGNILDIEKAFSDMDACYDYVVHRSDVDLSVNHEIIIKTFEVN